MCELCRTVGGSSGICSCGNCAEAIGLSQGSITPDINLLNAKLNPICHLLALLGAHLILHVSRIRTNVLLLCVCVYIYKVVQT